MLLFGNATAGLMLEMLAWPTQPKTKRNERLNAQFWCPHSVRQSELFATESKLEGRKRRDLRSSSPQLIAAFGSQYQTYTPIVSSKHTKQVYQLQ